MSKTPRFYKIVAIGDSIGFIIPRAICHELNLKRGDYLDLAVVDMDTMIARRLKVVASDKFEARIDDTLPKINYGK